jgi:septal ring factor EnvC (AmiA/AmiB activator)
METVKNFIVKNYKTILTGLLGLFLLYWVIFILTPKNTMLKEDRQRIEALNDKIEEINKEQDKLESQITVLTKKLHRLKQKLKK